MSHLWLATDLLTFTRGCGCHDFISNQ